MKVKELIEELQKCNPEYIVKIYFDCYKTVDIEAVDERKYNKEVELA